MLFYKRIIFYFTNQPGPRAQQFFDYNALSIIVQALYLFLILPIIFTYDRYLSFKELFVPISRQNSR